MPQAKGSAFQLLLVEEATYKTTPGAPAGHIIPLASLSGDWFSQELINNPELRNNRNPAPPVLGNKSVTGSFSAPLHLDVFGFIQKHAIGAPATSGAGPYIHVSKVNFDGSTEDGDLPVGLELEHGFPDVSQYYNHLGCRINTLSVNVNPSGITMFEVGIVGAKQTNSTSSVDASPTEYTSDTVSDIEAAVEEGGSAFKPRSLSINLNNNLDTDQRVIDGTGEIDALPSGIVEVSGSITARFEDDSLLLKARNNTESSLKVTWTKGTSSLELYLPEIVYEPAGPTVSGPAGVIATLNFRGYYGNGADSTALKATLTNDVTSY